MHMTPTLATTILQMYLTYVSIQIFKNICSNMFIALLVTGKRSGIS